MTKLDLKSLLESKDLTASQINELIMPNIPKGKLYDHTTMHWGHNFDRTSLQAFNNYVKRGSLIQQSRPQVGDVLLGKQYKHVILHLEPFSNVEDAHWIWFISIKL